MKGISGIHDASFIYLDIEWKHSDLFYDVLNTTVKTNPV